MFFRIYETNGDLCVMNYSTDDEEHNLKCGWRRIIT
jgi:hypothetical protein